MGSVFGTPAANSANLNELTNVSWPVGVTAGKLAILSWVTPDTLAVTDPTSEAWTLVGEREHAASNCRLRILKRITDGSESGQIAGWNCGGTANRQSASLVVYDGYTDVAGVVFRDETVAGTSHDCPSIGTGNGAANGDNIVVICADRAQTLAANGEPPTTPITFTERITAGIGGSGGTYVNHSDDGLGTGQTMPFDPGSFTGMVSSSVAITATLALRPAAAGVGAGTSTQQRSQTGSAATKQISATASANQRQATSSAASKQIAGASGTAQRTSTSSAGQKGVARSAGSSQRTDTRTITAKSAAGIARVQTRNSSATAGSGAQQSSAGTSTSCRTSVAASGHKGGIAGTSIRQRNRAAASGTHGGVGAGSVQVRARAAAAGSRTASGATTATCRTEARSGALRTAQGSTICEVRGVLVTAGVAHDVPPRDVTLTGTIAPGLLGAVEGNRFSGAVRPGRWKGEIQWR